MEITMVGSNLVEHKVIRGSRMVTVYKENDKIKGMVQKDIKGYEQIEMNFIRIYLLNGSEEYVDMKYVTIEGEEE